MASDPDISTASAGAPLESMVGRTYGPLAMRISPEKVAEYVAATGDDPDRWSHAAPPTYAGALLFSIAPSFLNDPAVGDNARVLVHADQLFTWHGPLTSGALVEVTAEVRRIRVRGPVNFVSFDVAVTSGTVPLLTSTSTFLMGSEPAAAPGPSRGEPVVDQRGVAAPDGRRPIDRIDEPVVGTELPATDHGASRLDLVRYAAASGDFNPIHFDHEAARAAGLDGIVVHGLLMAAWLGQRAADIGTGVAPLREMKLRFRSPLQPATAAVASGTVSAIDEFGPSLALRLAAGDLDLVTASVKVRRNDDA